MCNSFIHKQPVLGIENHNVFVVLNTFRAGRVSIYTTVTTNIAARQSTTECMLRMMTMEPRMCEIALTGVQRDSEAVLLYFIEFPSSSHTFL